MNYSQDNLTQQQVADLLFGTLPDAQNLVASMTHTSMILAVYDRTRTSYPAFQFDTQSQTLNPIARLVNMNLHAAAHSKAAMQFWNEPSAALSGKTPLQALQDGSLTYALAERITKM